MQTDSGSILSSPILSYLSDAVHTLRLLLGVRCGGLILAPSLKLIPSALHFIVVTLVRTGERKREYRLLVLLNVHVALVDEPQEVLVRMKLSLQFLLQ